MRADSARAAPELAPEPDLYRGMRVGRAGELFEMLKFRTLIPDAEQRLGPYLGAELSQLTEKEVTRIGRFLRASKLDELPQLVNVVRGEMSLVGPRPIRPAFFAELCQEIPQYWQRLVVRPGITGLAQLRMTREMSWAEKLAHDLEYIADRSIALYLNVIFTTGWLMVFRPANRRSSSTGSLSGPPMCGICGVYDFSCFRSPDRALLEAMSATLLHRGPDGGGIHIDGGAGLAARRLAIIDLAHGDQPMLTDDGEVCVVQNGEILNHRELRAELEAGGATLRTHCDTEVLLYLYLRHGPAFVKRLRGMFAIALWDRRRRMLMLARDRFRDQAALLRARRGEDRLCL